LTWITLYIVLSCVLQRSWIINKNLRCAIYRSYIVYIVRAWTIGNIVFALFSVRKYVLPLSVQASDRHSYYPRYIWIFRRIYCIMYVYTASPQVDWFVVVLGENLDGYIENCLYNAYMRFCFRHVPLIPLKKLN